MKKNKTALFVLPILILFLISLASAQTLVAGKIYNSDFSDTIGGASVYVECNSNSPNTTSLGDGTYAIRFDVGLCNVGDIVTVTATKNNLAGEGNGVISVCDENQNCDDGLVSIVNLNLKEVAQTSNPHSGGSGSSGGYYLCGNGKCDSGENERTCPKDCKIVQINTTTTTQTTTENTEAQPETNSSAPEEQKGFFSRITGAVTGTLGNTGFIVIIVFILGILGLAISVNIIRKRKNKE